MSGNKPLSMVKEFDSLQVILKKTDQSSEFFADIGSEVANIFSKIPKHAKPFTLFVCGTAMEEKLVFYALLNLYLKLLVDSKQCVDGAIELVLPPDSFISLAKDIKGLTITKNPIMSCVDDAKKVALFLLHSQTLSQDEVSSTAFNLGAMLSSVIFFNVKGKITEKDLEHLKLFVKYGEEVVEFAEVETVFQNLIFVVHDWKNIEECALISADQYLHSVFEDLRKRGSNLHYIETAFVSCSCLLLPSLHKSSGNKITQLSQYYRDEVSSKILIELAYVDQMLYSYEANPHMFIDWAVQCANIIQQPTSNIMKTMLQKSQFADAVKTLYKQRAKYAEVLCNETLFATSKSSFESICHIAEFNMQNCMSSLVPPEVEKNDWYTKLLEMQKERMGRTKADIKSVFDCRQVKLQTKPNDFKKEMDLVENFRKMIEMEHSTEAFPMVTLFSLANKHLQSKTAEFPLIRVFKQVPEDLSGYSDFMEHLHSIKYIFNIVISDYDDPTKEISQNLQLADELYAKRKELMASYYAFFIDKGLSQPSDAVFATEHKKLAELLMKQFLENVTPEELSCTYFQYNKQAIVKFFEERRLNLGNDFKNERLKAARIYNLVHDAVDFYRAAMKEYLEANELSCEEYHEKAIKRVNAQVLEKSKLWENEDFRKPLKINFTKKVAPERVFFSSLFETQSEAIRTKQIGVIKEKYQELMDAGILVPNVDFKALHRASLAAAVSKSQFSNQPSKKDKDIIEKKLSGVKKMYSRIADLKKKLKRCSTLQSEVQQQIENSMLTPFFLAQDILCSEISKSGRFSMVKYARHQLQGEMAMKCFTLKGDKKTDEELYERILTGIEMFHLLRHVNVVRAIGFTRWKTSLGVALEYMGGNTLQEVLESNSTIHGVVLARFCADIASGMTFLQLNPELLIGDITIGDILVDPDLRCKVGGFKFSNYVRDEEEADEVERDSRCGAPALGAIMRFIMHQNKEDVAELRKRDACEMYNLIGEEAQKCLSNTTSCAQVSQRMTAAVHQVSPRDLCSELNVALSKLGDIDQQGHLQRTGLLRPLAEQ